MGIFKKRSAKTQEMPTLICDHSKADTYKCIFLANYRNLPIQLELQDSSKNDEKIAHSLHVPSTNQFPIIKDDEITVSGTKAVLTYLNIKGQAPSIHPRKARILAAQQYWIQVLVKNFQPLIEELKFNDEKLELILTELNNTIDNKDYILEEFSLADIYWFAVLKTLEEKGQSQVFQKHKHIASWFAKLQDIAPNFDEVTQKVAA